VKLFVARFWSDFKESEAVCAKIFLRGSSVLGMRGRDGGGVYPVLESEIFLYVLGLNPNRSNLEGFGTPASFSGAWTKHWCRAEGFATRLHRVLKTGAGMVAPVRSAAAAEGKAKASPLKR
jgi:hypothetical protein